MAILWHSGHGFNLNGIVTIDELDQLPCASRLNISKQNFAREGSTCPQTFLWKGRNLGIENNSTASSCLFLGSKTISMPD